jgi:predicted RNase H-like HicB family nuclease
MKYLVVIEESETGFGAYVPDLPGCIAAAASRDEVTRLIHEAIEFHLDGLGKRGSRSRHRIRRPRWWKWEPADCVLRLSDARPVTPPADRRALGTA